jgi:3-oxoadipate enol-lactonase
VTLPHEERGDGPAVLLLHAGIADRRMWDEHLDPLAAAGNRAVAVDLPGFGEAVVEREPVAHWEDVVETMDALGIERAAVVGNSFGGAVALRLAAVHPDRVAALVLVSVGAVPDADPSPQLLGAWEAEERARGRGDFAAAVEAVLSAWVRPGAPDAVRERIATMQRRNYDLHGSGEAEWTPDPLEDDPALLGRIDCPTLLLAGQHDMVDFRDALGTLAAGIPGSRTATIEECGHLAPLEAPEEFRRLALDALARA